MFSIVTRSNETAFEMLLQFLKMIVQETVGVVVNSVVLYSVRLFSNLCWYRLYRCILEAVKYRIN